MGRRRRAIRRPGPEVAVRFYLGGMSTEVLGREPVRPGDAVLRVGARTLDLAARAVVVGLVEVRADSVDSASAAVAAARRDGAVVVELVGHPEALRTALLGGPTGTSPEGPRGCRVATPAALEVAAAARVELLTLADAAIAERLVSMTGASGTRRWVPTVIAPPSAVEVLAPRWARYGGSLVVDASLDLHRGGGDVESSPTGTGAGWVQGVTLASEEPDVVAATSVAVFGGARVVRTPWVRPARRAADLVATLLIERWEDGGPADAAVTSGGAAR
jgi:hypothetical protein